MRFNNKNVILPEPWVQPGPANDEIWYTSSDGNIVTPYDTNALPTIVSNTYADGKGVIKCTSDITSIGNIAFFRCGSLTSVTIGNSVTSIGEEVFAFCTGLTSVTIPDGVRSIEGGTFIWCTGLTSVTIPNSVTSIGNIAFQTCTGLTTISYTGTMAQYNAITKGFNWNDGVPATVVHCTDGDTPL